MNFKETEEVVKSIKIESTNDFDENPTDYRHEDMHLRQSRNIDEAREIFNSALVENLCSNEKVFLKSNIKCFFCFDRMSIIFVDFIFFSFNR